MEWLSSEAIVAKDKDSSNMVERHRVEQVSVCRITVQKASVSGVWDDFFVSSDDKSSSCRYPPGRTSADLTLLRSRSRDRFSAL